MGAVNVNSISGNEFSYEIISHIGEISRKGDVTKEVNIISFAGSRPKYDIRSWIKAGEDKKIGKGLTLDEDEFDALKDIVYTVVKDEIHLPEVKPDKWLNNPF